MKPITLPFEIGKTKFTDDDLKRLRQKMNGEPFLTWSNSELSTLLSRMEAAEVICRMVDKYTNVEETMVPMGDAIKAWRKAAGKK